MTRVCAFAAPYQPGSKCNAQSLDLGWSGPRNCRLAATPAAAQTAKLEDGVMAVPVVGLAFSLGYLADDLNLWEKHGVRIKTVQISGIGAMNAVSRQRRLHPVLRQRGDAGGGSRAKSCSAFVGTINRPSVQIILRKDVAAGFDPKAPLEARVKALRAAPSRSTRSIP